MEVKLLEKVTLFAYLTSKINAYHRNTMPAWNEERAGLTGQKELERE